MFLNSKLSLACKLISTSGDVVDEEDGGYDDYGGYDGNDNGGYSDYEDEDAGIVDNRIGFEAGPTGNPAGAGGSYGFSDLIDEEPQVENIAVAYETIAKRVDVR